ncbi:MAG TPA: YbaK/EbsC family protein [Candidatus Saccharimonadales bacterium]
MTLQFGKLTFQHAAQVKALLGTPVINYLEKHGYDGVRVSEIDASLADTAAFCEHYEIGMNISANCVIVEAKRADRVWHAACLVLATSKVDVNGIIRKALDARKISFAPMETATSLTCMEYGGITPIGLPSDWPIFIDSQVIQNERVILGSGIRKSKILIESERLQGLPHAKVLNITKN